ncbi:MAG TPA: sigma-70 family RNA polymerase sigma factor [Pirellulales bacterium]
MSTDWNELVRREGPGVYSAAWRILGHEADTEDVVQNVFLEAHRLWCTRPTAEWIGILRSMATRRALDQLRRRRSFAATDELLTVPATDDPVANAIERELAARLAQVLADLPTREAEVFCLRFFEDFSYEQIAAQLGISGSAVSTALNKARTKLAVALERTCKGD